MNARSTVAPLVGLALGLAAAVPAPTAARCAPIALPAEVRQSAFVVEAELERAGVTATFRTVVVWKGGADAPTQIALGSQQGRGRWPWADAANVGRRYVLFLRRENGGWYVARCGATAEASDGLRAELRAQGLSPRPR